MDDIIIHDITSSESYDGLLKKVKRKVEEDMIRRGERNYFIRCDWGNNDMENLKKGIVYVEVHLPIKKKVRKLIIRMMGV